MTSNINVYLNNLETQRANRAREEENLRHNKAVESETQRTNFANEAIKRFNAYESMRHNTATERQARYDLQERKRSAMATESLRFSELAQTRIRDWGNISNQRQSIRNQYQLGILGHRETRRSNKAREAYNQAELARKRAYDNQSLAISRHRLEVDESLGYARQTLSEQQFRHDVSMDYWKNEIQQYNARTGRLQAATQVINSLGNLLKLGGGSTVTAPTNILDAIRQDSRR